MSDHEFEKKVQQKMDDLRLRPSDAVWAEVERNLRREKRRRRALLWLPLMGILLTAGGYIIYTGIDHPESRALVKTQPAEKTVSPQSSSVPAAPAPASGNKPGAAAQSSSTISSTPNTNNQPSSQNSTPSNNKTINETAEKKNKNKNASPVIEKPVRTGSKNELLPKSSKQKQPDDKKTNDKQENKKPELQDAKSKEAPKTTVDSNVVVYNDNTVDDANKTDLSTNIDSAAKAVAAASDDTAAKKSAAPVIVKNITKKKQSSASKWQWGVQANANVANISEGNLFDVLKSVRVEDLTDAGPQYLGIPPVPAPEPSPIKPGPGFTVGAFVQRNLSKRFSLSAGLQYSLFTVNTRIGRKVDSMLAVNYGTFNSQVASSYYRADMNMRDYTNRYHFVELPLTAGYRIINSKKMPLVLDVGVSFSRLLNTNALHFDGISRVYYENDDFFNNMQFSLNGGLNLGLFQNSKHPLWVGPNLRYFTTGLIKKEVSASGGEQHIWGFGLNAKMLLKK